VDIQALDTLERAEYHRQEQLCVPLVLLALNGLRVSEAIGADIEALGLERGHRTLTVLRKGGNSDRPLAPRTARAVDLAIGERLSGPIFVGHDGWRFDQYAAGRIVRRVARRAGVSKPIGPHTLRHAFITGLPWTQACPSAMCKKRLRTPTRARPCAMTRSGLPRPARHVHRKHLHSWGQPIAQLAVLGADGRKSASGGALAAVRAILPNMDVCHPQAIPAPFGSERPVMSLLVVAEGARLQRLVGRRQQVLAERAAISASRNNGRGAPWHPSSAGRNVEPLVALGRLAPAPGGHHASASGISAATSPACKGSGRSQRGTWRRSWPVTWVVDGLLSASPLARCSGSSGRASKGSTAGQLSCHGGLSRT
jgi:hypothetical protein